MTANRVDEMEFSFAEIFCWFGLCGVVYRSIAHENTPTFESEKDEKRNHLLRYLNSVSCISKLILFVHMYATYSLGCTCSCVDGCKCV